MLAMHADMSGYATASITVNLARAEYDHVFNPPVVRAVFRKGTVMILPKSPFGGQWLVVLVFFVGSSVAFAQTDVTPQSELNPDPTFESALLSDPTLVPGKEYSNDIDKNAAGIFDSGQVVHWDGDGTVTSVWDSFDYKIDPDIGGEGGSPFQVDALANIRDIYFLDLDGTRTSVYKDGDLNPYKDTVSLMVSFQDTAVVDEYEKNIYASRSAFRDGSTSLWAEWDTNINATAGALDDVDGLEFYGPDQTDDANMYSREDDPIPDGETVRFSVFRFKPDELNPQTETFGVSVPYLATEVLLNAVIDDDLNHPDWGGEHNSADFDVDAMMIWDVANDDVFNEGDMILFSVRPIVDLFDGGEIWLYKFDNAAATFLVHGEMGDGGDPRIWNTAHEVSQHFFGDDSHSENINALEAVPEPSTLALILVGGLIGGTFIRVRRRE